MYFCKYKPDIMAITKGTYIEIDKDLLASIKEYCEINGLKLTPFINELLQKEFMIEKYGEAPSVFKKPSTVTQNNVIKTEIEESGSDNPQIINETPKVKKKIKTY